MTEEALFHAALAVPAADRSAYLAAHCPDPDLRRCVEALFEAHDRSGGPLDTGAYTPSGAYELGSLTVQDAASGMVSSRSSGTIGPYKLLQRIGEGGMGEVFMAEQTEPVKRLVAVKVIKPGLDTRQVIARFEAERQALALMDHPNIAKVLDAGTIRSEPAAQARVQGETLACAAGSGSAAGTGRPYFVMELVKGVPITRFCDDHHLSTRERLRLFIPVCQAVQHAHQKGIIHRDLKPNNVLVALYDDRPVPKVIDFGVAKAAGEKLTDRTMFTEFGAVVGTLEYMSPEQARLNQLDVDTRTDVYGLGVLLYELLTGSTPFDRKRLRSAAFDEVLRIIREEDPPKPSTRLGGSAELPAIAACRKTEPMKLSKLVRGELDWIVMKALEKDRSRRYETANGLARDVQRYLTAEPVEACPPSATYRLRKFAQRHQSAAAVAVVAVLAVAIAMAGLSIGFVHARESEVRARAERDRFEAAQARADRNFDRARQAVDTYVQNVIQSPQLRRGNFFELRKSLLSAAVPFLEEFVREKNDDPMVHCEQGLACLQLALVQAEMGDHKAAARDYATARDIYRRLSADSPAYEKHRYKLGAVCNNLSTALSALGRHAEAEDALRESIRVKEQLVADFPENEEYRRFVAVSYHNLAAKLTVAGKPGDAVAAYGQALAIREKLLADHPSQLHCCDLAYSYHGLAQAKKLVGEKERAEALYAKAFDLRQRLVAKDPQNREYRDELAVTAVEFGSLLAALGRPAEAEAKLRLAVTILERLTADFPAVPIYRGHLARARDNLADFLWHVAG